ncbi:MAG: substrate-binding domain-containing protein [Porphyromonadaceae bacterium]|nr:substrate-binding domain-containing protein [Porphyromonadaceae bacterium]
MATQKRVRIKDIAKLAGVSAGTVDRIVHNRGNVSKKSREAVEKVLKEVNYRPNIHMSSISLKKKYDILFVSPKFVEGEYWGSIYTGVLRALDEFENINVSCKKLTYNQYDVFNCKEVYSKALKLEYDAVIIGPIFQKETQVFCSQLTEKGIPYVFVDSDVDQTSPIAYFSANHYISGYLMCKLINSIMKSGKKDIGIMQAMRVGNESANSTILRKSGFQDYLVENKLQSKIHKIPFSATEPEKNEGMFDEFFEENKDIGGIVVLNSRGNVIANYLNKKKIDNIKLVCVDLTNENIKSLKNGIIDFLIGQKPERQGYLAMKFLLEHLIFKMPVMVANILPLDILTKETIDLYREFNDLVYLDQYND